MSIVRPGEARGATGAGCDLDSGRDDDGLLEVPSAQASQPPVESPMEKIARRVNAVLMPAPARPTRLVFSSGAEKTRPKPRAAQLFLFEFGLIMGSIRRIVCPSPA